METDHAKLDSPISPNNFKHNNFTSLSTNDNINNSTVYALEIEMEDNPYNSAYQDILFYTLFAPFERDFKDHKILWTSNFLSINGLLAFRVMVFLYILGMAIENGIVYWSEDYLRSFSFLTNWSFMLTLTYFASSILIRFLYRNESERAVLPFGHAELVHQLTFQTCFSFNFCIVVLFWTLVFNPAEYPNASSIYNTVFVHGINCLFIFSDLWLGKMRLYYRHSGWSISIAVIYMIINLTYVLLTGRYLYSTLDWRGVMSAVSVVGAFILILVSITFGRLAIEFRDKFGPSSN